MCLACRARYFGIHLSTDGFLSFLSTCSLPQHLSFSLPGSNVAPFRPTTIPFLLDRIAATISTRVTSASRPRFSMFTHIATDSGSWSFPSLLASKITSIPYHTSTSRPRFSMFTHHHSGSWSFLWLLNTHITEPAKRPAGPTSRCSYAPQQRAAGTYFFRYCFGLWVNAIVDFKRSSSLASG